MTQVLVHGFNWKVKFALFWRLATCGLLSKNQLPSLLIWVKIFSRGVQGCIGRGRGLHAETAWSALTVILKLVIVSLSSIILIVLRTVSLQLQGWFVSISLSPVLRIVAADVRATA